MGGLRAWDVRKQRVARSVHGFAGAIRDLQQSESGELLAACGLDRYVRVINTSTSRVAHAVYLKNRVNACCVWAPAGGRLRSGRGSGEDEDEGEEESGDEDDDDDDDASDRVGALEMSSDEDSGEEEG